jgi:hypothetical protein
LTILIKQSQNTPSEYVNYTLDFQKPIVVEVISVGNATSDALALVNQLKALTDRFGYNYVTASVNAAEITIKAKEYTQRFKEFILSEAIANANSITQFDQVTLVTGVVTTLGALGFGDDAWMLRSIMLPTAENVRYFGISKDERPIMGGQYTEYALRYSIAKDGNDGTWGAGTSVTTHVFYVLSTLQAAFETALNITFPGIIEIAGPNVLVLTGDSVLDLSLAETTTIVAQNGTAPYSYVSSIVGVATIVAGTGVVTAVGVGTTVITATDAGGKTGTFSLTVVA